jgi:sulfur carrier protein
MKLIINGESREIAAGQTIGTLLVLLKVESPDMVSVQLNGEFVERASFGQTPVKEGDAIDFLYFMGGGSRA